MFITVKAVRGIQGRVHAGSAEIARRVGNRRVPKRSLNARSLTLCPTIMTTISTRFLQGSSSSSSTAKTQRKSRAAFSTAGQAGQAAPKANVNAASAAFLEGKLLPGTEEIVHDRFLSCIEREDAKGAMAHFSFIACEGGVLLALRRRQLLVLLCEKDMVKEASELLSSATSSPAFNSQDLSTIREAPHDEFGKMTVEDSFRSIFADHAVEAVKCGSSSALEMAIERGCLDCSSFMYVMWGCLRNGEVDLALRHFQVAFKRGIILDLPLCEHLATALFIKGLRGETAEAEAWSVLEYVRERGMLHRPEVCEQAILYAMAMDDLSFTLRMCQYLDEEGFSCDSDVRDTLYHSVTTAIKNMQGSSVVLPVDASDGEEGESKVEGFESGEKEELMVEGTKATAEELFALNNLLERWVTAEMEEHDIDDKDHDKEESEIVFEAYGQNNSEQGEEEEDDTNRFAGVVDYDGGDIHTMNVDDMDGAPDVVDFDDGLEDDDNNDKAGSSQYPAEDAVGGAPKRGDAWKEKDEAPVDFGGGKFSGDLMDQMSVLYPDRTELFFEEDDDDEEEIMPLMGIGRDGQRERADSSRLDVCFDLVITFEDPHGEGEQGIMLIPVKISVGYEDDNNDDDDDDGKYGAV